MLVLLLCAACGHVSNGAATAITVTAAATAGATTTGSVTIDLSLPAVGAAAALKELVRTLLPPGNAR